MELNTFWRTLLRRWYLVVLAVLVTVIATVFVVNRTGPTFRAQGLVLIFPPTTTGQAGSDLEVQGNPYLLLGGLTQARDVVIRTLTSKSSVDEFGASHPGVSYEVVPDFTSSSPMILVNVSAPTPDAAVDGLNAVIDQVPANLVELQSGLVPDESDYITATTVSADTTPATVRKSQIRIGLAVGAGTMLLTLLLIALADGLLLARRRGPAVAGAGPEAPAPGEDRPAYEFRPRPAVSPRARRPAPNASKAIAPKPARGKPSRTKGASRRPATEPTTDSRPTQQPGPEPPSEPGPEPPSEPGPEPPSEPGPEPAPGQEAAADGRDTAQQFAPSRRSRPARAPTKNPKSARTIGR